MTNLKKYSGTDMEHALKLLGVNKPFRKDGSVTNKGYEGVLKLANILEYLKQAEVIPSYDMDKIDEIIEGVGIY